MALISHASDAHDNAFTELLVVAYARVQVELDTNFAVRVSHKMPKFFQLNPIGQVPLLDTLVSHLCENIAIACYVTLWHHQSVPPCWQVESHNTLAYLAENVGINKHINRSDIFGILIVLNLENMWDTTLNQMCSIFDAPVLRIHLAPESPLLLLSNNQCISFVRAVYSFFREELKFPNHLIAQNLGSHLARVESAMRISKYDMLMKIVAVFEELVMIWCDNLQVNWFCSFFMDLFVHDIIIGVYVQRGWVQQQRWLFSVLIPYDIVAALAWAFIVIDFTVHTCENDSWILFMIESELPLFSTEAKWVLPCMSALDLARHSLEFGTRFNEESSAIIPLVGSNKSSLFPTDGFQSTYLDARVEHEFWANSDVECCSKCENRWPFVGEGYAQYCETSGALRYGLNLGVYWKGPKDDRIYSTCIADNEKGFDCNSLEMGNACLVIQDVNVVVLYNLAALEANLFNWLVDQMHRDIALAIEASGQNFVWNANTDRDKHDNNMIFVLLYSNLEGKVLFEGRSNVTNLAMMEDPIDILSNYIWDPG